jgi:hypothetical protein
LASGRAVHWLVVRWPGQYLKRARFCCRALAMRASSAEVAASGHWSMRCGRSGCPAPGPWESSPASIRPRPSYVIYFDKSACGPAPALLGQAIR